MARIFTEGFELGFTHLFDDYAGVITRESGRNGGYALGVAADRNDGYCDVNVGDISEVYIRFATDPTQPQHLSRVKIFDADDLEIAKLTWREGEQVKAYVNDVLVGTGTTIMHAARWYLIEIRYKYADSGGIFQVRVEGEDDPLEIDWSGDTKPGTASFLGKVSFPGGVYDDIAINDTTSGVDNGWPGDGNIVALRPNDNGDSSQFTGKDGNSTDNYLQVDETSYDSDTSYVESDTSSNIDLYQLSDLELKTGDTIQRVWVAAVARETSADSDSFELGLKPDGGSASWDSHVLTENYEHYISTIYLTKPGGGSWTEADVNDLQAGVKVP